MDAVRGTKATAETDRRFLDSEPEKLTGVEPRSRRGSATHRASTQREERHLL